MNKHPFFISLALVVGVMVVQLGGASAASASQEVPVLKGIVERITLDTDSSTGITTVIVTIRRGQESKSVRLSQQTGLELGLVILDGDGKPLINDVVLGRHVEVQLAAVLPDKDEQEHPVVSALATFFSDIEGLDYDAIMSAHEQGAGFGVIARTLWLTRAIQGGDVDVFETLLLARQTGRYDEFSFVGDDGRTVVPESWAELRKAILDGKRINNLGAVMSDQDTKDNETIDDSKDLDKGNETEKEKQKQKEKDNDK